VRGGGDGSNSSAVDCNPIAVRMNSLTDARNMIVDGHPSGGD
jgi:hypothetical protein